MLEILDIQIYLTQKMTLDSVDCCCYRLPISNKAIAVC